MIRQLATASLALVLTLATPMAMAADHTVTIKNFAFSPASLDISAGDNVTFVNEDGAPHTATANDGSFDTGRLSSGQSATVTFNSAGEFAYFCQFHPNMKATIVVQ
jgi:plastocyanin